MFWTWNLLPVPKSFIFDPSIFSNHDTLTLKADREESFNYSGSDNEEEETTQAGEPSSIVQAPAGDTLRRNFQQIQVSFIYSAYM